MANRNDLLRYARENRTNATKSEQILWKLLRKQQLSTLKFRRQHIIDPYVVDFACVAKMLVIEIDGGYHESIGEGDRQRQSFLESQGWQVLRFASHEIESNAESSLSVIVKALASDLHYVRKEYRPSGIFKPRVHKDSPGK